MRLFRWCIVSSFGIYVQRRQASGRIQLNFDLAPLAIASRIGGTISQDILVAQLDAYLGGYVRQFIGRIDDKRPSPGYFRNLTRAAPDLPVPPES